MPRKKAAGQNRVLTFAETLHSGGSASCTDSYARRCIPVGAGHEYG